MATEREIHVTELQVDARQGEAAIRQYETALGKAASAAERAARSADVAGNSIGKQSAAVRMVEQSYQRTQRQVDRMVNRYDAAARSSNELRRAEDLLARATANGARNIDALTGVVDRLRRKQEEAARASNDNARGFSNLAQSAGVFEGAISALPQPVEGLLRALGPLGLAIGTVAAVAAAAAVPIARAGDAMTQNLGRLNAATGDMEAAREVYEDIVDLSVQTGIAVNDSVGSFVRYNIAARQIGATRDEVLRLVETVSKFGVVSGASTQEATSGAMQLGQALASGRLQGDELRSILENMPLLAEALARELGVGIGELREMGAAGELTSRRVFGALLESAEEADQAFDKMPVTMERASSQMAASWDRLLAKIDGSLQLSRLWVDTLEVATGLFDAASDAMSANLKDELAQIEETLSSGRYRGGQARREGLEQRAAKLRALIELERQRDEILARTEKRETASQQRESANVSLTKILEENATAVEKAWKEYEARNRSIEEAAGLGGDLTKVEQAYSASLRLLNEDLEKATKEEKSASKAAEDRAKALASLRDELDPVGAATQAYEKDLATLDKALAGHKVTTSEYATLVNELGNRYLNDLAAAGEQVVKTFDDVNSVFSDHIEAMERENDYARMRLNGKGDLIPLLEDQIELEEKLNRKLTDQEMATLKAQHAERKRLDDLEKANEEAAKEWQRIWDHANDNIQDDLSDAFRDALDGNRRDWHDWKDWVLNLVKDLAAQIAAALVFRPAVSGMMTQLGLGQAASGVGGGLAGGAASLLSVLGVAGSGLSGVGGAVGSIGTLMSLATLAGSGGAANTLSAPAAAWIGNQALSLGASPATANALITGAGAAPWGVIGTLGANLVGLEGWNNPVSSVVSNLGSTVGGALIGNALLPGIGAVLGAIGGGFFSEAIGSVFSGLFGKKKPAPPSLQGSIGYNPAEGYYRYQVSGVNVGHGATDQGAQAMLAVIDAFNNFNASTGLTPDWSKSFGFNFNLLNASASDIENSLFTQIADLIARGVYKNVPPALEDALEEANGAAEIKAAVGAWLVARQTFEAQLKGMAEAVNQTDSPWTQAVNQFREQMEAAREQAESLGVATSLVDAAEANQLKLLKETINADLEKTYLELTDPKAAALAAFEDWADAARRDVQATGADMTLLEKVIYQRRLDVLAQYGDAAALAEQQSAEARLKARQDAAGSAMNAIVNLRDYTTGLLTGDMSALTAGQQLMAAERQFNAVAGAATAGDYRSIQSLPGVAEAYLGELRANYGSGAQYTAGFDRVVQALQGVSAIDSGELIANTLQSETRTQTQTLVAELQALRREVAELRQAQQAPARVA